MEHVIPSRQGHCMEPGCVTKCNATDCLASQFPGRGLTITIHVKRDILCHITGHSDFGGCGDKNVLLVSKFKLLN